MQEQSIYYDTNIFHTKVIEWMSKVGTLALERHSSLGIWCGVIQVELRRKPFRLSTNLHVFLIK